MSSPLTEAAEKQANYPRPVTLSGDEFITEYWDYTSGQHVTILAPTQWGKTTLCYQLLNATANVERPAFILVVKPRDRVVTEFGKKLGFRTIRTWPPPWYLRKQRGFNVWPAHTYNTKVDDENHEAFFRKVLEDCYKRGNDIVFADESTGITDDLNLKREVVKIHKRGAALGCGMWLTDQRPFYVAQTSYSQAEHLFLGNSADKRDRQRFGEIGGIDPFIVQSEVMKLQRFQWLYIRRTGPQMCVIDNRGERT